MAVVRQHIVREGQDLQVIARLCNCTEEEIKAESKNEDLWKKRDADGNVKEVAYWVVANDVVYVPDRPPKQQPIAIGQANPVVGAADLRTAYIKVIGPPTRDPKGNEKPGEPCPVGTVYRLTINAEVLVGEVETAGLIVRENVPSGSKIEVEWSELPTVRYEMSPAPGSGGTPSTTETSQSRASVLKPGSMAGMRAEASAEVVIREVSDDCKDRFEDAAATRATDAHPHKVLANKVQTLVGSRASGWTPTTDPKAVWDNTMFALHPLVEHRFPVPRKVEGHNVKVFSHRDKPTLTPDDQDKKKWNATAKAPISWYNRRGVAALFLGAESPPITGEDLPAEFADMSTAVNKRLVKLWMGELKQLVDSTANPWLLEWFGTDAGRIHFKNWVQFFVAISHWQKEKGSAHKDGKAIDIDYLVNPWAPLLTITDTSRTMVGENKRDKGTGEPIDMSDTYRKCARVYDRALRLFVTPKGADLSQQALALARDYYQNKWDWAVHDLHALYCGYQALNWALICYFDYRYGRATVPKQRGAGGWSSVNCDVSGESAKTKRKPDAVFERLKADEQGSLAPDATLILDENKFTLPRGVETSVLTKQELTYPTTGDKVNVWVGKVKELTALGDDDAVLKALIPALSRQIDDDHMTLVRATERDACRGIFNLNYDVVMAFGRMLAEARDSDNLRMFTFGQNSAGDFMHIDFCEDRRRIAYLDVRIDGKSVSERSVKVGLSSPPFTVVWVKANAAGTSDVTNEASVDASPEGVCAVEADDQGRKIIRGVREGQCALTATYDKLKVSFAVTVEAAPVAP